MKGLKGLLGGLMDEKGLFQGGTQDRLFGRGRDAVSNLLGGGEMKRARKFARGFDPGSKDDTLKMQQMLNSLGITDSEGNELKEDSMFGRKTESALRSLQLGESMMPEEEEDIGQSYEIEPQESFDYEPGKDPSGPVDPWASGDYRNPEDNRMSTMMRNNSPKSWINKLFGGGEGSKYATGPSRALFGNDRTRD